MKLPEGVNPLSFLAECQKKGIKITSRFPGVYFVERYNKKVAWKASICRNNKTQNLGYFPFTYQGEKDAHKAYIDFLRLHNLPESKPHGPKPRATT